MNKEDRNKDILKESLRKKFKDFKMPADPGLWEAIEKDMAKIERKKRIAFLYYGLSAAAVLLIAFGILFFLKNDRTGVPGLARQDSIIKVGDTEKNGGLILAAGTKIKAVTASEKDRKKAKKSNLSDKALHENGRNTTSPPFGHEEKRKENPAEKDAGTDTFLKKENPDLSEVPNGAKDDKGKTVKEEKSDFFADAEPMVKHRKRKKSFSLSVGMSGMGNVEGTGENDRNFPSAYADPQKNEYIVLSESKIMKADNSYRYKIPISFGLYFRKEIADRLFMETGLVYTYLVSEKSGIQDNSTVDKTEYELHYLGIPLKVNYNIYENKNVSLYTSAGGMSEKSFYGKETEKYAEGKQSRRLYVKQLQWSVSGSIGINCKLSGNMGIFAEPGLDYFFDDHSNIQTLRKESPLNFTMRAGIRFTY